MLCIVDFAIFIGSRTDLLVKMAKDGLRLAKMGQDERHTASPLGKLW